MASKFNDFNKSARLRIKKIMERMWEKEGKENGEGVGGGGFQFCWDEMKG